MKFIVKSMICSLFLILSIGCGDMPEERPKEAGQVETEIQLSERHRMVAEQIEARGIQTPEVLHAMRIVPRHEFVPASERASAYHDSALPIGHAQTISQPYIVGLMTELLQTKAGDKILEVGTGSGYQAAILAEMGAEVYTIEIVAPLAERARQTLTKLGFIDKVSVKAGDGFAGWPAAAPFDAVIITCAVSEIPQPLVEQLKPGGRMVLPLGRHLAYQTLTVVTKRDTGKLIYQDITGVIFVPMTGPHGFK